jgi:hypothetical protein
VVISLPNLPDSEFRERCPDEQIADQCEREERRRGGEHSCGSVRKDKPAEAENYKAQQDESKCGKREFYESIAIHSVES